MTVVDLETKKPDISAWKQAVLERDKFSCVNCDRKSHVAAAFIVPPEVGGRVVPSNGVSICRDCRLTAERSRVLPQKIDNKTPINFFVSKKLHEDLEALIAPPDGVGSLSGLIRQMMSIFLASPEQFQDLDFFVDNGSDVKINLWCPGHQYDLFKQVCWEKGISFTDAFKSLLMIAVQRANEE